MTGKVPCLITTACRCPKFPQVASISLAQSTSEVNLLSSPQEWMYLRTATIRDHTFNNPFRIKRNLRFRKKMPT